MNNIINRRRFYGMSLQDLAYKSKTAKSTVGDIENDKHVPNVYVAIRIARALETTVENLFWEEDENE